MVMKFFITGSHGWFGSWITRYLDGLYDYDVWDRKTFPEGKYDYVIHLAPGDISHVIEFARKNNATLLFTSSGITHYADNSPYYKEKLMNERKVIDSGLQYRVCQCYSFVSENMPEQYAISNFIDRAKAKQPLIVYNDGSDIRSYLHMADLVIWLMTILLCGHSAIYEVGGDRGISMQGLAELVNNISGNKRIVHRKAVESNRKVYVPKGMWYQNSTDLGLKTWTSLEDSIIRSLNA
jgi:nucleoside-diphosphate-sugar epimerase